MHSLGGVGVDQHDGGGLHAVPRALFRGSVGKQPPGRVADQRERPPGGVALDCDRLSRRRRLDRAGQEVTRRVTRVRDGGDLSASVEASREAGELMGAGGRDHRRETDENGLLRALGETDDRRRLGLGVAEAEPRAEPRRRLHEGDAVLEPAEPMRPPEHGRQRLCCPMRRGGAAAVAGGAVVGILCAALRTVARNAHLEVADQSGGGRMVEDERGRQIQPGERLELVAKLECDEGIDAQLDEGDLRIEPRRRVVPERSRNRRADGIGEGGAALRSGLGLLRLSRRRHELAENRLEGARPSAALQRRGVEDHRREHRPLRGPRGVHQVEPEVVGHRKQVHRPDSLPVRRAQALRQAGDASPRSRRPARARAAPRRRRACARASRKAFAAA